MRWSFARAIVRNETFFGITAIVIAVANAPIFQNIGLIPQSFERSTLVAFYICLTLSLLSLFASRLFFERNCPILIKDHPSLNVYLADQPDNTDEEGLTRVAMAAEWRTVDQDFEKIRSTRNFIYSFLFLFPAAFVLAIVALILFALGPAQALRADQPNVIGIVHDEECAVTPEVVQPSDSLPPRGPPRSCRHGMNRTGVQSK